jgi:hypothetical protein
MKKYLLLAIVAVTLMTQVADAGLFSRWRSRRSGRTGRTVAAAPATTPAAGTTTPAPAPAPTAPATPAATTK